jgi:nucleoside phosphorylase
MKILFVAAEAMEFAGMLRRAAAVRREAVAADWARSARLGGHDALLVANGVGWNRAAAGAAAGIDFFAPEAVVSTGFCGALEEGLKVADLVVANEILVCGRSSGPFPAAAMPGGAAGGAVCSIGYIVQTAAEKRILRQSGACAVEMEAAGVAESAAARRLPFYCIRAVTDLAGENLANDLNAALRKDGHFATIKTLRGALRHPSARLPELLRLRCRSVRAARALGDFFAECRF